MVWEHELIESNGIVQFLVILALEGEFTTKQGKHEDTECPDVRRWARILDLGYNFRSHIRRCSAEKFYFLLVRDARRETKVDKFDSLFGFIEQNVLQLDISVCYIALVAVVDGLDDLAP